MSFSRLLIVSYTLFKTVLLLAVVMVIFHLLIGTIFVVSGHSMDYTLQTGEYLYVNKISYLTSQPQRGDIVILRFPGDPKNKKFVKRLIGLPGEKIEISGGKVFIDGKELIEGYISPDLAENPNFTKQFQLGNDDYLFFGDNRLISHDSRIWGPATKKDLIGKAEFILYPFNKWGTILQPIY